jgi:hypothetical protein
MEYPGMFVNQALEHGVKNVISLKLILDKILT